MLIYKRYPIGFKANIQAVQASIKTPLHYVLCLFLLSFKRSFAFPLYSYCLSPMLLLSLKLHKHCISITLQLQCIIYKPHKYYILPSHNLGIHLVSYKESPIFGTSLTSFSKHTA